jgi:hypothetical protein
MIDGSLLLLHFHYASAFPAGSPGDYFANSYFLPDYFESRYFTDISIPNPYADVATFSLVLNRQGIMDLEIQTQIEDILSINRRVDDTVEINQQIEFTVER